MSITSMPSKYLKCPACAETPHYGKLQSIVSEDLYSKYRRPFDPSDPVVVSETEVYCSTDCFAISVIRKENEEEYI